MFSQGNEQNRKVVKVIKVEYLLSHPELPLTGNLLSPQVLHVVTPVLASHSVQCCIAVEQAEITTPRFM